MRMFVKKGNWHVFLFPSSVLWFHHLPLLQSSLIVCHTIYFLCLISQSAAPLYISSMGSNKEDDVCTLFGFCRRIQMQVITSCNFNEVSLPNKASTFMLEVKLSCRIFDQQVNENHVFLFLFIVIWDEGFTSIYVVLTCRSLFFSLICFFHLHLIDRMQNH